MSARLKYRKKLNQFVVAVPLDLETKGFVYRKWGGRQRCKRGDWLVSNGGDVYTVDRKSFRRTYRSVGNGRYLKTTPIWAEVAKCAGVVKTKEGGTRYKAGDYLVSNEKSGADPYAMRPAKFKRMYRRA